MIKITIGHIRIDSTLFFYELESPDVARTTLSQSVIGGLTLSQ